MSRSIKELIHENAEKLMSIPGVIGVGEGALDDGTPCLLVLVVESNPDIQKSIPADIGGVPVKIEVTGEIKGMSEDGD